jgi:DNA-binding winged helix-turn-helix (wHTH) protein/Tol biopolymer transport system component
MSLPIKQFYEFEDFRLDAAERVLLRNGKPLPVTPKIYQLLLVLVENHGRIVEKDNLMNQVWADSFVEESNLTFTIRQLRKILGDDAHNPRFIETVPRRGYRFIADVRSMKIADEEKVTQEDKERKSSLSTDSPSSTVPVFTSHKTQSHGAVVALANWRRDEADDKSEESARACSPENLNGRTAKPESFPNTSPVKYKRGNYFYVLAGLISIVVLTGFGYGLYRFTYANKKPSNFSMLKITRLTSNGKTKSAAVAPDGKFVAYVLDEDNRQSLRLKNIATDSDVVILPPAETTPLGCVTFSPDGNHIYYGAKGTLFQLPVLGGTPKKVLERYGGCSQANQITFSPDGKQFAFIRYLSEEKEETAAIFIADADGTNERILASSKRPNIFTVSASWSPDGKTIACGATNSKGFQEVVFVRVADGVVSSIPHIRWNGIRQVIWQSDGSGLLIIAAEEKSMISRIWTLSYPSGEVRKLTNDSNNYLSISLTADRCSIVAARTQQEAHIWLLPGEDPSQGKQLTSGFDKYDGVFSIGWQSDGRIIYEAMPDDKGEFWTIDASGGSSKKIAVDVLSTAASPDGNYLVFSDMATANAGLFRLNVGDGERKRLTIGDDSGATFSPDGRWIVFTRYAEDVALWKVSIEGGEAIKLTNCSGYPVSPTVSPDGKFIAFIRGWSGTMSHPPLSIIPFEGGEIIKAFNVPIATSPGYGKTTLQWTADGQAINILNYRDGVSNIWRQPIDGSPPAQMTNFQTGLIFNFSYSPDGRQLALSRGTFNRDVILINNSE